MQRLFDGIVVGGADNGFVGGFGKRGIQICQNYLYFLLHILLQQRSAFMSTEETYEQTLESEDFLTYLRQELSKAEREIYEAEKNFYNRAGELQNAIEQKERERTALESELQEVKRESLLQKIEIQNMCKKESKKEKKSRGGLKQTSRKQLRMFDFRSESGKKNGIYACSPKSKFL